MMESGGMDRCNGGWIQQITLSVLSSQSTIFLGLTHLTETRSYPDRKTLCISLTLCREQKIMTFICSTLVECWHSDLDEKPDGRKLALQNLVNPGRNKH